MRDNLTDEIYAAVQINQKQPRGAAIAAAQQKAEDFFAESYPDSAKYIATIMDEMVKKAVRRLLLVDKKRAGRTRDGRASPDNLRGRHTADDPRLGALHSRRDAVRSASRTLGMMGTDDQVMDGLKLDEPSKRFILHYNSRRTPSARCALCAAPGRREIGHGALAERALRAVFPEEESFPTSCARSPTYSSPTAPAPWPRYAAEASR